MGVDYLKVFRPIAKAAEKYNDPQLVVNFQEAFGIKREPDGVDNQPDILTTDSEAVRRRATNTASSADHGEETSKSAGMKFRIENYFWYYLFKFGAFLGDDAFYISFYPFWIWNIDGAVGRRLCLTWTIAMYFGQALKDIVCWPRPASPPVARLEQKYASEQGMPSTHALIGFLIPVSAVIYTSNRYEYPVIAGIVIAAIYCLLVCGSRLYLGMHSVSDVVAGLAIGISSTALLTAFMGPIDHFLVTDGWAPFTILTASAIMLYFYPKSPPWSRTQEDTAITTAASAGICFGAWMSYRYHFIASPQDFFLAKQPPYPVIWPSLEMCGLGLLRLVIGLILLLTSKSICRRISKPILEYLFSKPDSPLAMGMDDDSRTRVKRVISNYLAYGVVAFNVTFTCQAAFTRLGIVRPLWYTEL